MAIWYGWWQKDRCHVQRRHVCLHSWYMNSCMLKYACICRGHWWIWSFHAKYACMHVNVCRYACMCYEASLNAKFLKLMKKTEICVCVRACVCVCVCVCADTHTCVHAYMHTEIRASYTSIYTHILYLRYEWITYVTFVSLYVYYIYVCTHMYVCVY